MWCSLDYPGIALVPSALGAVVFMTRQRLLTNLFILPYGPLCESLPSHLLVTGSGIVSGVGNLLSAISPFILGWLIQVSGSYTGGLLFLVAMAALGAVCCVLLYLRKPRLTSARKCRRHLPDTNTYHTGQDGSCGWSHIVNFVPAIGLSIYIYAPE